VGCEVLGAASEAKAKGAAMSRTVVNVGDEVVSKAIRMSGVKKKVRVVDLALSESIRRREARKILELAGKVDGDWDLREWRKGRYE